MKKTTIRVRPQREWGNKKPLLIDHLIAQGITPEPLPKQAEIDPAVRYWLEGATPEDAQAKAEEERNG